MSIQLAMVGLVVSDMGRSLEFYRRLGLDIPPDDDDKRFVMHRMPSGVTIFFDSVFFSGNDPDRQPVPRGAGWRSGSFAGKKTVSKKIVTPLGMRCMTNRFSSSSDEISSPSRR